MHRQARADKCEGPTCDRTEQLSTRPGQGGSGETASARPTGHRGHKAILGKPLKPQPAHSGLWAGTQHRLS